MWVLLDQLSNALVDIGVVIHLGLHCRVLLADIAKKTSCIPQ